MKQKRRLQQVLAQSQKLRTLEAKGFKLYTELEQVTELVFDEKFTRMAHVVKGYMKDGKVYTEKEAFAY